MLTICLRLVEVNASRLKGGKFRKLEPSQRKGTHIESRIEVIYGLLHQTDIKDLCAFVHSRMPLFKNYLERNMCGGVDEVNPRKLGKNSKATRPDELLVI